MKANSSLREVAYSDTTPWNIRKIARESMLVLKDAKLSIAMRAANAISMLDEVTQDPKMPSFARVALWSAISELESIRE